LGVTKEVSQPVQALSLDLTIEGSF
jgi:hypothetical protein